MGMWVFLCSEVMFFTGLIGSYIVLRFAIRSGRNPGDVLNIWLTAANTFILICSSVTMVKALEWIQKGDMRKTKLFMCLTLLGGSIFLGVQVFEYRHLLHEGFNPHVSLFGSTFYTMTGFHGFHVFCGVVCIAFVHGQGASSASTRRSTTSESRRSGSTGTSSTWSGSCCSRSCT